MTDKERLEEVTGQAQYIDLTINPPINLVKIKVEDYEWLIEQAKRVEELERELEEQKSKFTFEYTTSLHKQNNRYREALEKIKSNVKICGNEEYFPKVVEEIVNEVLGAIRND